MATFKDLKRAATEALRSKSLSDGVSSPEDRLSRLVRTIESLARDDRTAARERAMRVSADGMYIRKNAGSYTSKSEADRAREVIERLKRK